MIKAELLQDAGDMASLFDANPNNVDQLLIAILKGSSPLKRYLTSDDYVFQEKHNGDRRLVEKQNGIIRDYNRNGKPGKGLPQCVKDALNAHPTSQFILDGELVGDVFFVFDILFYGTDPAAAKPYREREALFQTNFPTSDFIKPVRSFKTPQEKITLIKFLVGIRAEGFVVKDMNAVYRPAITNSTRFNFRYKFWKTLDAVVIGDTTERDDKGMLKNSVRLGCYDSQGKLKDICGSTKKAEFTLKPGDVVELKYLYGTQTLDVVQPTMLRKRTDKAPNLCTLDQLIVNKHWKSWRNP